MNKVNFLNKDNFPLYSEGLAKLQNAIFMTANIALLGGERYILSGCDESVVNNVVTVSDGLVVIDGEILELVGAAKKDKIAVREVKTPLSAFGVDYPESYVTRYVEFSATGEYNWSDFEKIPTNQQLHEQIRNINGNPISTVLEFAGFVSKIPKDYLLCDGRELSVSEYPELFEYIGTIHGGDGVNTFRLPDRGGCVAVGYSSSGKYSEIGKTGGSEDVSLDIENVPRHEHLYTDDSNAQGKYPNIEEGFPKAVAGIAGVKSSASDSGWGTVYRTTSVGGDEKGVTKPIDIVQPYIVQAFIIKVR